MPERCPTLVRYDHAFSIRSHDEVGIVRHHNDLPVRLAQPDEIIELGINRPVIEIVFRLINKDRVSRIAQVKDQVKQHQTPFAPGDICTISSLR